MPDSSPGNNQQKHLVSCCKDSIMLKPLKIKGKDENIYIKSYIVALYSLHNTILQGSCLVLRQIPRRSFLFALVGYIESIGAVLWLLGDDGTKGAVTGLEKLEETFLYKDKQSGAFNIGIWLQELKGNKKSRVLGVHRIYAH